MNLKELGHQSSKDVTFEVLLSSREKKRGRNHRLKPGLEELVAYAALLLPKDLAHRLAAKSHSNREVLWAVNKPTNWVLRCASRLGLALDGGLIILFSLPVTHAAKKPASLWLRGNTVDFCLHLGDMR